MVPTLELSMIPCILEVPFYLYTYCKSRLKEGYPYEGELLHCHWPDLTISTCH